jgi:tRNA(Arg) A34 adenosine deaminase TadA
MRKFLVVFAVSLFFCALLFLLVFPTFILTKDSFRLDASVRLHLTKLASAAIVKNDVPVASILYYQNRMIGEGFNTVCADTNVSGHAEVNAVNNAVKSMGWNAFNSLNRDSMLLLTTFQPCLMCRGMLSAIGLKHVRILQAKSLRFLFREWIHDQQLQYHYAFTNDTLQDSLFNAFPGSNGHVAY